MTLGDPVVVVVVVFLSTVVRYSYIRHHCSSSFPLVEHSCYLYSPYHSLSHWGFMSTRVMSITPSFFLHVFQFQEEEHHTIFRSQSILFLSESVQVCHRARVFILFFQIWTVSSFPFLVLLVVAVVIIVKKAVIPLLMLLTHWQLCSCLNSQYFLLLPLLLPLSSARTHAHYYRENNIRMKKEEKNRTHLRDRSFYIVIEFLLMVSA